jgi:hypothetical protein
MTELDEELRRLAEHAAERAWPLPPAEVLKRGDRRRARTIVRDAAIGVAAAIAVTGGVLAGVSAARHQPPAPPATRLTRPAPVVGHPAPLISRPARPPGPAPTPVPSPTGRASTPTPSPSTRPTPTPTPASLPTPTPDASPSRRGTGVG